MGVGEASLGAEVVSSGVGLLSEDGATVGSGSWEALRGHAGAAVTEAVYQATESIFS